jgi:folate-binding protein YgfZ
MPTNDNHPITDDRSLTAIQVNGADRIEFLQGQLTQDLSQLLPDNPLLAGWASPKGRLICTTWVVDWLDTVWLIVPTSLSNAICQRLRMFVLRADVQVEVSSGGVYQGAGESSKIDNNSSGYSCFYDDNSYTLSPVAGADIRLTCSPDTAPDSSSIAWRRAMIAAGMPTVWLETRESFVPQMLNLDLLQGISFDKGCYVGQEIVARTQNLGRIKRRMYRFGVLSEGPFSPGQTVYSGSTNVGEVVDAVATGSSSSELLAVVRIAALNTELSLDTAGDLPLQLLELPYSVPESSSE